MTVIEVGIMSSPEIRYGHHVFTPCQNKLHSYYITGISDFILKIYHLENKLLKFLNTNKQLDILTQSLKVRGKNVTMVHCIIIVEANVQSKYVAYFFFQTVTRRMGQHVSRRLYYSSVENCIYSFFTVNLLFYGQKFKIRFNLHSR